MNSSPHWFRFSSNTVTIIVIEAWFKRAWFMVLQSSAKTSLGRKHGQLLLQERWRWGKREGERNGHEAEKKDRKPLRLHQNEVMPHAARTRYRFAPPYRCAFCVRTVLCSSTRTGTWRTSSIRSKEWRWRQASSDGSWGKLAPPTWRHRSIYFYHILQCCIMLGVILAFSIGKSHLWDFSSCNLL